MPVPQKLTQKRLDDLRTHPKAVPSDVLTISGGELPAAEQAALDAYFTGFAKPVEGGKCISCGSVQGGLMAAVLGGGFEYGIAHGEGRCSGCNWPGRANHYIKTPDGHQFLRFNTILQYHSDSLQIPPARKTAKQLAVEHGMEVPKPEDQVAAVAEEQGF